MLEIKADKKDYPLNILKTIRIFGVNQAIQSIMINNANHREFEHSQETKELFIINLSVKLDQENLNKIEVILN